MQNLVNSLVNRVNNDPTTITKIQAHLPSNVKCKCSEFRREGCSSRVYLSANQICAFETIVQLVYLLLFHLNCFIFCLSLSCFFQPFFFFLPYFCFLLAPLI